MAQEQKVTSLDDFAFDDNADWSFGAKPPKDKTDTSTVVSKVKAGTTIDEDDEDDDETTTNLEDDKGEEEEEEEEVTTVKPPVKKAAAEVKPTVKDDKKKEEEEKEEEEEEEPEFFVDDKDKAKAKGAKPTDKKEEAPVEEKDDEDFYTDLATELIEKGVLENVELPKNKKLTEDEFFELHDAEIEARVGQTMEAFVEKMDDDGKAFIKHKRKGGSTKDFIETYYGSGIDYDKFDAENEAEVDELTRFYVSSVEGLKGDDLEDRLQGLKDSGKAKAKATEWAVKLQKIETKAKEELVTKVEEANKVKKEASKKFNESLLDAIDKTNTVGGFTISKEDKKKLVPFMTKATVKIGKDQYVPALQVKLAAILNPKNKESRERLIVLAKLVENDFDISDITPKVETQVVRRANRLLQRSKAGIAPSGGGSGYSKRVLSDMFDDEDD